MSKTDDLPHSLTLHVRDHCLCMHARRAARAIARRYDKALRPAGLTSGQFSILMSLNRPEPPGMGDVADLLALDRTTLTANMKPLERRGLFRMLVDPADRRGRLLALTDEGRAVLAAAVPFWRQAQAEDERRIGDMDADRVRTAFIALS
jgi:DNA-binding MarR family transcriptional regulator